MQQEPMRSPSDEDLDQSLNQNVTEGDSDFLLSSAQEAALLAEYGKDVDDRQYDLRDDTEGEAESGDREVTATSGMRHFHNHYIGNMELLADKGTVMKYFDAHQGWFRRCAHPFKADPIGETGYAMGIGKVGALGFQVDARVGLNLLPPDENCVYRIVTIPIPEQEPQGYEVDFQAEMRLQENPLDATTKVGEKAPAPIITSVEWDLNLTVSLQFPTFIQKLAKDMIQKTGDSVLGFIVQRVSKSLTAKVQDDFHKTHEIKVPKQIKLKR